MTPVRVTKPALILLALGCALFGIARTTGSGWLIVLLCGLVALLAVSLVAPPLALAGVRVRVEAPRDATAGRTAGLTVALLGRGRGLSIRAQVPAGDWASADAPSSGRLEVIPERRGVVEDVTVELRTAAPIGLVWWHRRFTLRLPSAMEVGPDPAKTGLEEPSNGQPEASAERLAGGKGVDVVRSTRPYSPGDPIKLVHWAATARFDQLMVKEMEAPSAPALAIVVDLSAGGPAAEDAASRAAGIANSAIRAGVPVLLFTAEAGRQRVGPVATVTEVGRRLARAVYAPPPQGPLPAGADVVHVSAR